MPELRYVSPRPTDADQLARLHGQYIGDELLAQLGPRFLRAYYRTFLAAPETGGVLAFWDGELAGVGLHSPDIAKVYKQMIAGHPLLLASSLTRYFLARPGAVFSFAPLVSWLFNPRDKRVRRCNPTGQGRLTQLIVCIVRSRFRTREFAASHGTDIAKQMVRTVQIQVRELGFAGIYQMVAKDNLPVKLLMRSCGFTTTECFSATGTARAVLAWGAGDGTK